MIENGAVPVARVEVIWLVAEIVEAFTVEAVVFPIAVLSIVPPLITGLVSDLFKRMSVVASPTSVSVAAGSVSVVAPATADAFKMVVPLVAPLNVSPADETTGLVNVPPVIVLPVKVKAEGSEIVGLPATPSPLVSVISLAVPVIVRTAAVSVAVRATMPFAARAS